MKLKRPEKEFIPNERQIRILKLLSKYKYLRSFEFLYITEGNLRIAHYSLQVLTKKGLIEQFKVVNDLTIYYLSRKGVAFCRNELGVKRGNYVDYSTTDLTKRYHTIVTYNRLIYLANTPSRLNMSTGSEKFYTYVERECYTTKSLKIQYNVWDKTKKVMVNQNKVRDGRFLRIDKDDVYSVNLLECEHSKRSATSKTYLRWYLRKLYLNKFEVPAFTRAKKLNMLSLIFLRNTNAYKGVQKGFIDIIVKKAVDIIVARHEVLDEDKRNDSHKEYDPAGTRRAIAAKIKEHVVELTYNYRDGLWIEKNDFPARLTERLNQRKKKSV